MLYRRVENGKKRGNIQLNELFENQDFLKMRYTKTRGDGLV